MKENQEKKNLKIQYLKKRKKKIIRRKFKIKKQINEIKDKFQISM